MAIRKGCTCLANELFSKYWLVFHGNVSHAFNSVTPYDPHVCYRCGDPKFWLVRMYNVTQRCPFLTQIFSYFVVLCHVPWGTGTLRVPVLRSKLVLYGLLWNREFLKLSVHGWNESRYSYCPVFSNPSCLTADTTVGKYFVCFCGEECELNCYAALESYFLPFCQCWDFPYTLT